MHERALKIVYNDYESIFQKLLDLDNFASIHYRNIYLLAAELYETKNNLSSHIMSEFFDLQNIKYYLCSKNGLFTKCSIVHPKRCGGFPN